MLQMKILKERRKNMEILLDENVNDKAGVKALGIQVGDIIAMDPRTVITESGYIKSRFLDDKLSVLYFLNCTCNKRRGMEIKPQGLIAFHSI